MEVFLAAQHRIVLKDHAGVFTVNDIDESDLEEADFDDSDELDTASFEEYLSEHDDEIPGAFIEQKYAEKSGSAIADASESATEAYTDDIGLADATNEESSDGIDEGFEEEIDEESDEEIVEELDDETEDSDDETVDSDDETVDLDGETVDTDDETVDAFETETKEALVGTREDLDADPGEEDHPLLLIDEQSDPSAATAASSTELSEDTTPDPGEVLVFAPWDEHSSPEDEIGAAKLADSETEHPEQSPFLNESSTESSEESSEEERAGERAEDLTEELSEDRTEELTEESTEASAVKSEAGPNNNTDRNKARGYSTYLNPAGYRMHDFSVDHVIPPQIVEELHIEKDQEVLVAQADQTQDSLTAVQSADALESEDSHQETPDPTPKIESLETLDSSMDLGALTEAPIPETGKDNQDRAGFHADDFAETVFREDASTMVIPTLVPDVVASEAFPASTETPDMAWLQKVGDSSSDYAANEDSDYTGAEDKAQIRSNLSELTDDDSLDPLEQENLEAIKEVPVELHSIHDPLRIWKTTAGILACIILCAGLAGQFLFYNLDTLVFDNRFDRITNLLCQVTRCPDNQVIDLTNLVTQELDVRSHPSVDNALQVNFIFRNDAAREQAFPLVELNFTDISGDVIANRVFTRTEYLPPEMSLFTHMPAHSSIQVNLELVDPGEDATGYSLVFRNP